MLSVSLLQLSGLCESEHPAVKERSHRRHARKEELALALGVMFERGAGRAPAAMAMSVRAVGTAVVVVMRDAPSLRLILVQA